MNANATTAAPTGAGLVLPPKTASPDVRRAIITDAMLTSAPTKRGAAIRRQASNALKPACTK
jgi:hypothetical protein